MYKRKESSWVKHLDFAVLDIIILELSFFLAYSMRHHTSFLGSEDYRLMAVAVIILDLCVMSVLRSYSGIIQRGYIKETIQVIQHASLLIAGLIVYMFFAKSSATYSRLFFFYFYVASVVLMVPARLAWKRVLRVRRKKNRPGRRVVLVTEYDMAEELLEDFRRQYYRDYQIIGIALLDQEAREKQIAGVPVIADATNYRMVFWDYIVDEVFINTPHRPDAANELMAYLLNIGITVHVNLGKYGLDLTDREVDEIAGHLVLTRTIRLVSSWQMTAKRGMDIAGALVGLLLTGIAAVIFGPIIYHQSPGPIFFSQERIGRHGRPFRLYKFRSMCLDAEEKKAELMEQNEMDGHTFKMEHDPRIIPIGRFMRKYSIDELPQFWNVLKGDMSLVGTRPPTAAEVEGYEIHHRKRLAFKPGITGMWQVSGRSNITDFEEVVRLDARYLSEWSLKLDIKIILQTVLVVLKGSGAS